MLHVKNN